MVSYNSFYGSVSKNYYTYIEYHTVRYTTVQNSMA